MNLNWEGSKCFPDDDLLARFSTNRPCMGLTGRFSCKQVRLTVAILHKFTSRRYHGSLDVLTRTRDRSYHFHQSLDSLPMRLPSNCAMGLSIWARSQILRHCVDHFRYLTALIQLFVKVTVARDLVGPPSFEAQPPSFQHQSCTGCLPW